MLETIVQLNNAVLWDVLSCDSETLIASIIRGKRISEMGARTKGLD
jgi:hypothetical protein